MVNLTLFIAHIISSTLKMEAIRSSETSVYNKPMQRHIPEDTIPHSHHCENLKSYTVLGFGWAASSKPSVAAVQRFLCGSLVWLVV
jgi:hypothetical protein